MTATRAGRVSAVARRALLALGALLTLAALLAGAVNREILDENRFAAHVDSLRMDDSVSAALADAVTDRALQVDPDLVALRPVIGPMVTTVVRSSVFTPVVHVSARQLYRALTRPGSDVTALRLADVGAVVVPTLRALAPDLAARLPADFDVTLARVGAQGYATETIRAARLVRTLSWTLPLGAAACFGLALLLARDRRRTTGHVGVAVTVAGLGLGVVAVVGDAVVASRDHGTLRDVLVRAAWHELSGAFWPVVALTVVAGVLLTAVSTGLLQGVQQRADGVTRAVQGWAARRGPQAGRGVLLVVVGALLVIGVAAPARVVLVGLGMLLVAVGAALLLPPAAGPALARDDAVHVAGASPSRSGPRRPTFGVVAAVVAGVLLLASVAVVGARPTVLPQARSLGPVAEARECNGSHALCDRPYDQVSYPATHNSMSAADEPSWFFAEQPTGIVGQLDAGVRALLIDTWLGQATQRPGVVATTGPRRLEARAEANETWGADAVASALRLRNALGLTPTGPVEPYLCHNLCELGATRMQDAMAQVAAWLAAHPREVVTFIVQDEEVSPEQTADVFAAAGLMPYVYEPPADGSWPTLGEMVDSGHRLVVMMENHGGGTALPWLLQAFDRVQDTPYTFRSADDFSCDLLRGSADNPLLLVNHWLSNARTRVSDAATVNAYDVLWPRVQECTGQRGHVPNFVAVDFYDRGDLFEVVNQLNHAA